MLCSYDMDHYNTLLIYILLSLHIYISIVIYLYLTDVYIVFIYIT